MTLFACRSNIFLLAFVKMTFRKNEFIAREYRIHKGETTVIC